MSEKIEINEQTVREMAKLSLQSNRINQIQEKNLKLYPFIFFETLNKAEIEYDFSIEHSVESIEDAKDLEISYKLSPPETKHFKIIYKLDIANIEENVLIEKRFSALENVIRDLFWKEIKVMIYVNEEKKYESQ